MRKSILKVLTLTFLICLAVTSCEILEDCKTCEPVTNNNGTITTGPGILTCGDDLERKESENVTVGNNTSSYYNCY